MALPHEADPRHLVHLPFWSVADPARLTQPPRNQPSSAMLQVDPEEDAITIDDIADRLFTAIERGDYDVVESLWAADVTVWHSGDTDDNDRGRALKVIEWFIGTTTNRSYQVLDRVVFEDGFVQQHLLRADGANGSSIVLRVCIVIKVDADGLIMRIDEYFDPADLAALLQR